MSAAGADVAVRRASVDDLPAILALAGRSLGWEAGAVTERHFAWKHLENPFGPSPMWVAEVGDRLAGFRTFLRWELRTGAGEPRRAVRAVDTATDPDFRGRGVFTRLTLGALEELRAEGVDFVFNTPNAQSRPGYLKMGWQDVGRLPVAVRPTGIRGLARIARARTPAARGAVPTEAGQPAAAVLADRERSSVLIDLAATARAPAAVATHRTPEYLAWRFGPDALHYRVVAGRAGIDAGVGIFHLRRRGPALEAVLCELLVAADDDATRGDILGRIARDTGADYLIGLRTPGERAWRPGFLTLRRIGPVLTARAVNRPPVLDPGGWALTMGDIELF